MTAIAGYVCLGNSSQAKPQCGKMLEGLARFGERGDLGGSDNVCFGRILRAVLPEDDHDRQPLMGGGGRFLLTTDARIDNRSELAGRLGLERHAASLMSDADLLLAAWERWQIHSFSHLLGDIALAVWDFHEQRLTLARSASALKPLFYHRGNRFVAFASMPHGLHAIDEIPKKPDLDEFAAIAAGLAYIGRSTCFSGVNMVRHGHAVELHKGQEKIIRTWDLDRIEPGSIKSSQCSEALRAELDRAVNAQLRRRQGGVAAQLSSGRDSSAVTAAAACLLRDSGEKLTALTGAPRLGFDGPIVNNRIADESFLAAKTAGLHKNITHIVCRSRRRDADAELRRLGSVHYGPMLNVAGLNWNVEVSEEACKRAAILLIGSTGNFSISAGGPNHLPDLWAQSGLFAWWSEARRLGDLSARRWRNVANVSIGPMLPELVYRMLMKLGGRDPQEGLSVPILRRPYRDRAEQILRDYYSDLRPPSNYYDFRRKMLFRRDNAEKMNDALWGLDVRDPTGDRRLIELCLSFPADQLVSARATRPVYEAAFAGRIPPEVLKNTMRGMQSADWFELFDRPNLEEHFRDYQKNEVVRELFDFTYISGLLQQWPRDGTANRLELSAFRNELLGALAIANFIDLNFPN